MKPKEAETAQQRTGQAVRKDEPRPGGGSRYCVPLKDEPTGELQPPEIPEAPGMGDRDASNGKRPDPQGGACPPEAVRLDEDDFAQANLEGRVEMIDTLCRHLRDTGRDPIARELFDRFRPTAEDERRRRQRPTHPTTNDIRILCDFATFSAMLRTTPAPVLEAAKRLQATPKKTREEALAWFAAQGLDPDGPSVFAAPDPCPTKAGPESWVDRKLRDPKMRALVEAEEAKERSATDDGDLRILKRYQRCAVRLWELFPTDPLGDDPAHFYLERLEALLDRGLLAPQRSDYARIEGQELKDLLDQENHQGWLTGMGLAAGIVRGHGDEETAKRIDGVVEHCPGSKADLATNEERTEQDRMNPAYWRGYKAGLFKAQALIAQRSETARQADPYTDVDLIQRETLKQGRDEMRDLCLAILDDVAKRNPNKRIAFDEVRSRIQALVTMNTKERG